MKRVFTGLVVFTLLVFTGCSLEPSQGGVASSKTYTLGVIIPLTGDAAAYGEEVKHVLDYEIEIINESLASSGVQFELLYEDGRCDGASAVMAFQKLTDVDGVEAIIGGICSSESLGIAPLLKDKGIVAVSGWSSNPELEGKSTHFFSLSYSDDGVGKGVAEELSQYKKVAFLTEQNDYNYGITNTALEALSENYSDVQIVAQEEFSKGNTDFRNQLQKLKASDAEAIFLNPNVGVTAEALVKQFAEIQDWNVQLVSIFSLKTPEVIGLVPEALEGTVIVDAPAVNTSEFVAYQDKIIAAKGSLSNLGSYYVASSLDVLHLLTDLIVETDSDTEAIQKALALRSFSGYLGNIRFAGHTFVQGVGVARFVISGGEVVLQD